MIREAHLLLEFAASDDVAGVCEGLARAFARCAEARFASVIVADPDDGSFDAFGDPGSHWRFLASLQGTFNRNRQDGDPAQRAFAHSNIVAIPDVQADGACRAGFAATSAAFGVRSVVAMPIIGDGVRVGAVAAYFDAPSAYAEATFDSLRGVAAHGGAAIVRARRFERLTGDTEQLNALVAEAVEGLFTLDDGLRVGLWNRAAERMTGVCAGDLVGNPLATAFLRIDSPSRPGAFDSFDALVDAFGASPGHTFDLSLQRSHGEMIWLSIAGALVGGRSRRRRLVCSFRDITEQKRLEGLRREFVSLVTHQLRTPLTAIRGYAELLGAVEMPPAQVMEFGGVIAAASVRLGRSITDVMEFERPIASRSGLNLTRITLAEALDGALLAIAPSSRHSVKIPAAAREIALEADLDRLTRVFTHLIDNSIRYWLDGGEIIIDAAREGDGVAIDVVDRGPGIAADASHDLFSPFHHAARGHARAGQGLGLGLSLSKRIVEAHGGRIAVGPTAGGGTTVRIWLPAGDIL